MHERSLRSNVEIAQRDADEALRERKTRMEELSALIQADKFSDLIQVFREEFDEAKKVSDEKNLSLREAEKALIEFQSGITDTAVV
jgi:uncharacterized protein (DUF111 family)